MEIDPLTMAVVRGHMVCAGGATTLCIEAVPVGYVMVLIDLNVNVRDLTPVQTHFFVQITDPVQGNICVIGGGNAPTDAGVGAVCTANWTSPKTLFLYPGEFLTVQVPVATSAGEANWQAILIPTQKEAAQ